MSTSVRNQHTNFFQKREGRFNGQGTLHLKQAAMRAPINLNAESCVGAVMDGLGITLSLLSPTSVVLLGQGMNKAFLEGVSA